MTRRLLVFAAAMVLMSGTAYAQEPVGAGPVEIESALFGGGALFMPSMGPQSMGYVLNAAATWNVNRLIGIEGDFAWAMSRRQALALYGVASANQGTPNMLFSTGNIVVSPAGHHHKVVPYAEVGGGTLNVLHVDATETFGIAANSAHLIGTIGGGVRWFPLPHWGVRVDYRYIAIRNQNPPNVAAVVPIRSAQRLYGALVCTF